DDLVTGVQTCALPILKNKRLSVLLVFAALALASPCQAQQTSGQQNSTPQQALDKRQDAFRADKAKGVHASYQWELSGPNGGEWRSEERRVGKESRVEG